MNHDYVFNDADTQREYLRLRAIEETFDPSSRKRLQQGLRPGARCLEIGPGAGSLARWMAKESGPSGQVSAIEINPRFLKEGEGFEIIPGDILKLPLEENRFDVIHARYVLVHLPEHRPVLEKLRRALKPGGWMVLEEPDFRTAKPVNGTDREKDAVRRVNRAIEAMYAAKGIDPSFGTALPALMDGLGMKGAAVEMETPLVPGGTGVAEVMARSAEQLAARYQATGEASAEDIGLYAAYCRNPERWAVYYATVGVCFRKPD